MRNLSIWQVCCQSEFHDFQEKLCVCYGHHEESKLGEFFICSNSLVVSNIGANREIKWTKDLLETASPNNRPVNITFLALINTVSVGLANGELFTISNNGSDLDLAGVCDDGLLAMEWSPDQELLVLVTNKLNVILMSCTFDSINETNLLNEQFGEKQFINVGWGKKETQFHGSAGKQAAKTNTDIVTDNNTKSSEKIIISWRGDGALFAVGFAMHGIRRFKIFDREGNLQYTSEIQQDLEDNLSWRPSGNLIATTQKLADKQLISFFEKNGLKHGEFVIPINSATIVEDLLWSSDSEILTVICYDTSENIYKVLLFTTSNYHWYLKQTLTFEENISKIMWDNDFDVVNNKKMHVLLQNGDYLSYTWIWNIDHSKGTTQSDNAVVTVIDGTKVLISDFRFEVMPPPLANFEVDMGSEINSIHFAPENCDNINSNSFVVVTNKNLIFLEQVDKYPFQHIISNTISISKHGFPFQYYNWHWLDKENFLCAKVHNYNYYEIVQYKISDGKLTKVHSIPLHSAVTRIHCHPSNPSMVFLQMATGEIVTYQDGITTHQEISFPQACHKFSVLSVENEIYFLGLSHKGHFYLNCEMVMNNVNSYFVHTSFLLITTLKHMLFCVELTKKGFSSIASYEKVETSNIYKRKIERGSKLIISVPKDTRTVFQMPRGNLETMQLRPLSLKIIGEYLDMSMYHEAFNLMRKQRINLNLIYDHNPMLFKQNIDVFLNDIKNNSWLSLFLSDLENTDVTKAMYSSSYTERRDISEEMLPNKVHYICNLVRLHLTTSSDSANRILPLLTTFVKKNTVTDLEEALTLVKELKKQECWGAKLPITADDALKYLLYMVNVDHLFDVALGMYDFELVLFVANKSQKDPKEYIPMLNNLNEMDENYRKFSINKHLKRFDRAVQSLAKCGENKHGELRTFVKYHSLYREALALFSMEDEIYKQISEDFGLYLRLKKQLIEAGIIYEKAKSFDKAIECYKEGLEWELALKLAQNRSKEELKYLAWDLADRLKEEKRYKESIALLEQYTENIKDIINFAINSGQYKTALRLCAKYNNLDLIETNLLPSLMEEYASLKDLIETNKHNFIKYTIRLQIVREIKIKKAVEEFITPYAYKDSDLYSDAGSTIASTGSGRSYRSSKNRRKHERKVASLKEGSQYEDTALVLALHGIVSSSFDLRLQVKDVIIALSCLNKDEEALILQSTLDKLLTQMKDNFKMIWSNDLTLEATSAAIAAENVADGSSIIPQGIATLEPHLRIAPLVQELSWKLEGLSS